MGRPVGSRNTSADVADMDTARMMTVATSSRAPRQPDTGNDKDTGKSIPDGRRIPGLFVWLVSCAVVLLGLAIYSPSLNILPLADDWIALHLANLGSGYAFGFQIDQSSSAITGYHFDPISQGIIYVVYQLFGDKILFRITSLRSRSSA